jgi:hypothetical protein
MSHIVRDGARKESKEVLYTKEPAGAAIGQRHETELENIHCVEPIVVRVGLDIVLTNSYNPINKRSFRDLETLAEIKRLPDAKSHDLCVGRNIPSRSTVEFLTVKPRRVHLQSVTQAAGPLPKLVWTGGLFSPEPHRLLQVVATRQSYRGTQVGCSEPRIVEINLGNVSAMGHVFEGMH